MKLSNLAKAVALYCAKAEEQKFLKEVKNGGNVRMFVPGRDTGGCDLDSTAPEYGRFLEAIVPLVSQRVLRLDRELQALGVELDTEPTPSGDESTDASLGLYAHGVDDEIPH